MKNIANLMKQAKDMQSKMGQLQEELEASTVTGESGGGKIVATLNGKGTVKKIEILDKTLVNPEDTEMLCDLITAAINSGREKINDLVQSKTKEIMQGIQLPEGMELPV